MSFGFAPSCDNPNVKQKTLKLWMLNLLNNSSTSFKSFESSKISSSPQLRWATRIQLNLHCYQCTGIVERTNTACSHWTFFTFVGFIWSKIPLNFKALLWSTVRALSFVSLTFKKAKADMPFETFKIVLCKLACVKRRDQCQFFYWYSCNSCDQN